MKMTFLGTGTSHGVPMIGCRCQTCSSADPRDKRSNSSVLLSLRGKRVLIDCGRDFRAQALREGLDMVDYLLITHTHFDHIAGIDDLRVFNHRKGEAIPLLGKEEHLAYLKSYTFHYLFDPEVQKGGGVAELDLVAVQERFPLEGVVFEALPVYHGDSLIYGYRFAGCAYLCDVSRIPTATLERLYGLDVLVLDALRFAPHPTHFSLSQALEVVAQVKPRQTYFTHMCHDIQHEEVERRFRDPDSPYFSRLEVHLAYDGLVLEL